LFVLFLFLFTLCFYFCYCLCIRSYLPSSMLLSSSRGLQIYWSLYTCDRSVVLPGTPFSSTKKTDRHDIAGILLNTIALTIYIYIHVHHHKLSALKYSDTRTVPGPFNFRAINLVTNHFSPDCQLLIVISLSF
jgi:hypothetical protein